MKRRVLSVCHKFSTSMTLNMKLRSWTFKPISFMHALSALLAWTFIIRSGKIWACSDKAPSSWFSSSSWRWRIYNCFRFSSNLFTMNSLFHINWVMPKNVFISCLLFFLITSFLFGMRFEIIFNNAVKNRIPNSCSNIFSTSNALLFFCLYQFGQTCSTKSMIARLYTYWNIHDLITKRTSYLLFKFTGKTVSFAFLILLFFILLFCLLLFLRFLLFLHFLFLLIFFLF